MPILNSALTRSAPRSAMRLASSWTVIASGTTTSRTCLADGPASMMVALFLLARAAQRGQRAGAAVVLVGQRAGDGELAAMALLVAAAAARTRRLGPLGRGRMAGTAEAARPLPRPRGGGSFGLGGRLGGAGWLPPRRRRASSAAASSALRFSSARRRSSSLCSVLGALLAAARFLERGQARFLGLAKQLLLELLARA